MCPRPQPARGKYGLRARKEAQGRNVQRRGRSLSPRAFDDQGKSTAVEVKGSQEGRCKLREPTHGTRLLCPPCPNTLGTHTYSPPTQDTGSGSQEMQVSGIRLEDGNGGGLCCRSLGRSRIQAQLQVTGYTCSGCGAPPNRRCARPRAWTQAGPQFQAGSPPQGLLLQPHSLTFRCPHFFAIKWGLDLTALL